MASAPGFESSRSPIAAAATATPSRRPFIESWFSKLKERLIWRSEFETLDQARAAIGAYVERYHHRPHQFLGYRSPKEVRQTWEDARETEALRNQAA
ncbi:MAG TPA: integrase core domain-containing protein [Thermoleophilaceae bacterium]|nr:integrase core domain-containing protein [Thermoleophilaceae bacterium]